MKIIFLLLPMFLVLFAPNVFAVTFGSYINYQGYYGVTGNEHFQGDWDFKVGYNSVIHTHGISATVSTNFQLTNQNKKVYVEPLDYGKLGSDIISLQRSENSRETLTPIVVNRIPIANNISIDVQSLGEYISYGGVIGSPPITFNPTPAESKIFYYDSQFNGLGTGQGTNSSQCGPVYTQLICNTTTTVTVTNKATNEVKIYTDYDTSSNIQIGNLPHGNYKIDLNRTYRCDYGGFMALSAEPWLNYTVGTHENSYYYDEDTNLFKTMLPGNTAAVVTECSKGDSTQPKFVFDTQSYEIVSSGESCSNDKQCEAGSTCCSGYCYEKSTGVCSDIMGNGVNDWIPYVN